jgi:photosystem II stability/assembly factor-like uncharacterized protein
LDAGVTWTLNPFSSIQVGPNSPHVQFTSDKKVLYAVDATGDNLTPVTSTDGGTTWLHLPTDPTGAGAFYLLSDPTTTTRLFVSSYSTLYFSANAGKTWRTVVAGDNNSGIVTAGAQFDGQNITVGTSLGVFTSKDGGTSFTKLNTPEIPSNEQIVSFASAKAGTTTRFFAVTLATGNIWGGIGGDNYSSYKGVYSLDFGTSATWTKRVSGIPSGTYPFFVRMAANDVNDVYLGGSNDASDPIVLKSTDGGKNWSPSLLTTNNQNVITGWQGASGDRQWSYDQLVFGLTVCATDAKRAAFTGFGFCHITKDGGKTWQQVYVNPTTQNPAGSATPKKKTYSGNGLENTSSWWVAWADAANVWASFSDIQGIRSTDSGKTWSYNYTGQNLNSSYQGAVGANGTLYMATSSIHDMYESTHLTDARMDSGVGDVLTSADKGKTWTKIGSIGHVVMSVALDPTNAKRLYATVAHGTLGGVYVCSDITKGTAATWKRLSAPPRTHGHAYNISILKDGTLVVTYSGRMAPSFTDSSGVFVSTNGGTSWADRSAANVHWWTMDLTVDPSDTKQNTWYTGVFSGWGGAANNRGGLYKTTNRGVTWTQVWSSDRVASATVDPNNSKVIYATTETEGLWACTNATSANPTFKLVPTYPFRQPSRVFFNPFKVGEVWVTSFGNGIRIGQQTGP